MNLRLPLLPTLFVLLAIPTMIALGFWQLRRAEWKEGVLAQMEANSGAPLISDLPANLSDLGDQLAFRRSGVTCMEVAPREPTAARDARGRAGYRQIVWCHPGIGEPVLVSLGVAQAPTARVRVEPGTRFVGTLVPREAAGEGEPVFLLVAETPVAPLAPEAAPTVDSVPNNHKSYAVQWFGFALTLAIIYAIYLKAWRRGGRP